MDKIIEALEMAQTELKSYYRKIQVDRSNILTAVEDAIVEAKGWKEILDEYKPTNHTIEIPLSENATMTTTGSVTAKIHLT
jgi:hypothetical protein